MFRMTRLTPYLALVVLAAAPLFASAQNGGAARPSRAVDECGKPLGRARPVTPRPAAGATPAATPPARRDPPVLLGVPASGAAAPSPAAGPPAPGAGSTSPTPAGAQHPPAETSPPTDPEPQRPSDASTPTATGGGPPAPPVETAQPSTGTGRPSGGSAWPGRVIDPREARRNRDALRLGLNELGDRKRLGPAASVSVPTAFGVDGGEMFFGVAYQGRTRYTEFDDAAAVVGLGIGTRRVVALEAALTSYSTIRSYPFETGGLSIKVHRALPRQTSVAVGYENALAWGGSDAEASLYGAVTRMVSLRQDPEAPFSTAVFTLGVGNGRFRFEEDDANGKQTVNLFAAAGARVTPQVSLVADWTGQDVNAAASLTPLRHIPLVVTVGLADLTGLAGDGARLILSLGYGLALRQPF